MQEREIAEPPHRHVPPVRQRQPCQVLDHSEVEPSSEFVATVQKSQNGGLKLPSNDEVRGVLEEFRSCLRKWTVETDPGRRMPLANGVGGGHLLGVTVHGRRDQDDVGMTVDGDSLMIGHFVPGVAKKRRGEGEAENRQFDQAHLESGDQSAHQTVGAHEGPEAAGMFPVCLLIVEEQVDECDSQAHTSATIRAIFRHGRPCGGRAT